MEPLNKGHIEDNTGIFRGRKLSRIGEKLRFHGENFRGLLARTAYCLPFLQTIAEKTFADRHKRAKFLKVFPLESYPLHGNTILSLLERLSSFRGFQRI